jgi:hypothetical protein
MFTTKADVRRGVSEQQVCYMNAVLSHLIVMTQLHPFVERVASKTYQNMSPIQFRPVSLVSTRQQNLLLEPCFAYLYEPSFRAEMAYRDIFF